MAMRSGREASANNERLWRAQIESLVDADELGRLSEQSLGDSLVAMAVLWVEVIVLLAAANLLPRLPLGWAIAGGVVVVVLMGLRMNAFGVILHEGSHGFLATSRRLNDRLCNWGVAFWTINSVEEYRPTHRLHHRYLGQERDPDRTFYLVPAHRGALTGLLLQDLLGVTAFRRATTRLAGTSLESGAPASLLARPQLLVGKALTQLVVLGQFLAFQGLVRGVVFYVVFWLIPIVCMYPMILRLKTIAEHFDAGLRDPSSVQWTARTSVAGRIQNHLVGARMEYHFEHHVVPTIPYRGLKRLHRSLDRSEFFAHHDEVLSHGYLLYLSRAVLGSFGTPGGLDDSVTAATDGTRPTGRTGSADGPPAVGASDPLNSGAGGLPPTPN
jgi:fatty acid desaturase